MTIETSGATDRGAARSEDDPAPSDLLEPVAPGLLRSRRLAERYWSEFNSRMATFREAYDDSDALASVRAAGDGDLTARIIKVQAAKSWATVATRIGNIASAVSAIGLAFLAGAFAAVWYLSDRPAAALPLACAVALAVFGVVSAALHALAQAHERRAPAAVCVLAAAGTVAAAGLTPLALLASALSLLAAYSSWQARIAQEYVRLVFVAVALVALGAGGLLPALWDVDGDSEASLVIALAATGAVLAVIPGLWVIDLLDAGRRGAAAVRVVAFGVVGAAVYWAARWLPLEEAARGGVVGAAAGVVAGGVLIAVARAIAAHVQRWKAASWPEAVIVDTLVSCVLTLEYGHWRTVTELDRGTVARHPDAVAAKVASELVAVAVVLRRDLPRRLATGSEVVDGRVRDDAAAMAGALYEWVLALRMEGRPALAATQAKMVAALPAATGGEWQRFPHSETLSGISARSRVRAVAGIVRRLAVALVPLALVVAVSNSGADLPDGAVGSLYTFALTFFGVSLLGALDPRAAEDVGRADSVFKSLKEAIPLRGAENR